MTRRSLILTVLIALVPALAGLVVVRAATTPAASAATIPAAVVNLDTPATAPDGSTLPAGRLLVGRLTDPGTALTAKSATGATTERLDYSVVTRDTAAEGLTDGTYEAVITIPAGFSQAIASTLGGTPEQAAVEVETSQSSASAAGAVSQEAVSAAVDSLGTTISTSYLNGSLSSLSTLSDRLGQASTAAETLSSGAEQLAAGIGSSGDTAAGGTLNGAVNSYTGAVDQLAANCEAMGGSAQLCASLRQVSAGSGALTGAASSAATGASRVSSGASALNDGLSTASGAVPSYSDQEAEELADSLAQPVSVSARADSDAAAATRMSPQALSLALWIGALVVVSGLGIMGRRHVEAAMTPARLAITSLRPALGLAVVQATLLTGALALAGARFGNVWAVGGLVLLGAVAMTVLHAALMAAFGARGTSAVSLLALVAQAAWVLSVNAPGGMAGALPVTVLDSALGGIMLGTAGGGGWSAAVVLCLWAAASTLVMTLAVRRRRATSLAVLRRELAAA